MMVLQKKIQTKGPVSSTHLDVYKRQLIAARLDMVLEVEYIRNAVCIGFIANEVLSIVENAGLMGVPMPSMIKKAVDILKDTAESGAR